MHRLLILILYLVGLVLLAAPAPVAATQPSVAQANTQSSDESRSQNSSAAQSSGEVVVLTVNGAITPVAARYVERGLSDAEQAGARAVVLRLDTPGGLDTAMRAIIQRMLVSRVPVITYVSPTGARAASAGTFISYAAHVAAMAPSTTIGSASPVNLGEGGQAQPQSDTMQAKATNDAVSYIRGLAERRGRNADWAERAVREAANLTATDALAQQVVDIIATDLDDLLRQAHGRTVDLETGSVTLQTAGAATRRFELNWAESFLQLIADPTIAYMLLSLALLALYLEFANPGSTLPGVAGVILLVMALFALGSLPVNWAGVLLIAFAFILFAADWWLPGHGALSIGGLIAFVLGSLLLIDTTAAPALQIAPAAIATVTLSLAAFALLAATLLWRDRRRRAVTGREGLIGSLAVARTRLNPDGTVFIEGERWHAISQNGPVEAGQPVRVIAMRGLDLIVTSAAEQSVSTGKEHPE